MHNGYGNCSKFLNTFFFLFSNIMWIIKAGIHKMLFRIANREVPKQTGKTLIRLLLQKQSNLGLLCLSKPFWQETSVPNFRKFTVTEIGGKKDGKGC